MFFLYYLQVVHACYMFISNRGACVLCSCLCRRWSLKANKEKHLCSLMLKPGEPLWRNSKLQEVIGALEGKEGEECEEHDDYKKMEDAYIKTKTDDADYTLGALLLTLNVT